MGYLVDTNILLRSCQPDHPMYESASTAVEMLLEQGESLHLTPQNIVEFWNVATRPLDKNGLGMTPEEANTEVIKFEALLPVKLDIPAIHQQWRSLVFRYGVKGVNVHDARLTAASIVHGLTHVLTFNIRDFKRYTEVITVHPDDISKI
ncbi:MAG: type II toxin-antitoxin system VapC family toxin [Cyanobacteria bacterium P01_G01_bin.39]